jgi:hypothetical protein
LGTFPSVLMGNSSPDTSLSPSPPRGEGQVEIAKDLDEQAMDKLMKSYEAELSNPVRGIIFGNLMTAMLIQVCE